MPWVYQENEKTSPKRDIWDKLDIGAEFLSSVVIALVGLWITDSMQRQQNASTVCPGAKAISAC